MTSRAPTQRKSAVERNMTTRTAPSYVITVKSARNWRAAMAWNWAIIEPRSAASPPAAFTVSMPLMASICCDE